MKKVAGRAKPVVKSPPSKPTAGRPSSAAQKSTPATTGPQRAFSGAPWEKTVGYCRALRVGAQVFVSGTAPIAENGGVFAPGDAYEQTRRCFEIALAAMKKLGAEPRHVVRTRLYVTDIERWNDYGRAHGELFHEHPPATAMVEVSALIDPAMMVEVEVDAVVA